MADLETLKLKIIDDSDTSVQPLENLASALTKVKTATSGSANGLNKYATGISAIASAVNKLDASSLMRLKSLSDGIQKLQSMSNVKLSATLPKNITNLSASLSNIPSDASAKISTLANALTPLTQLGKSNLAPFVTQLSKLPTVLNQIDMQKLYNQISSLTRILKPFAAEMATITAGFDRFPTRIQNLVRSTERYNSAIRTSTTTNNIFNSSFAKMIAKLYIVQRVFNALGSLVNKSNEYQESLNLFTASMGEYADAAFEYGQTVSEVMGIDISDWIYNQGIFMTLATGFGVAGDSAAKMSEQLTQLGYDIASFYNLSVKDAMLKLQSGLSGELEPLRRLGYDLSQARLEQEALNLGIDKSVSSMTQAEKAQLRYIAIMTQVTQVQGDMARTLESPANQLRILQAQLAMAARAIGNIFIPALNAILPYAIAVVQAIREIADAIASLFGFEITEVDYSGIDSVVGDASNLEGELGGVNDQLKKMESYTLGFDELNVLNQDTGDAGGAGTGSSGGFDFELPEYDFLGDAVSDRIDGIMDTLRPQIDWLKENLDQILTIVGIIGAGFLAWKISSGLVTGIGGLLTMLKGGSVLSKGLSIALGFTLVGTSIALLVDGIKHAVEDGLQDIDFVEMLMAALGLTGGGAVLGSAFKKVLTPLIAKLGLSIPATLFGAAFGAIGGGVTLFFVGVYDALMQGLNWINASLIPIGTSLAGAGVGALIGSIGGPLGTLVGLATGLLVDLWIFIYQNWNEVVDFVSNTLVTYLPDNILYLFEVLSWVWNWNKFIFSETWDNIKQKSQKIFDFIIGVWSFFSGWFSDIWVTNSTLFSDNWLIIKNVASQTWENIKGIWQGASEWFDETVVAPVKDTFGGAWNYVSEKAIGAWETIKETWSGISSYFSDNIAEPIEVAFVSAMDGVRNVINKLINWVNGKLKFDFNGLEILGEEIIPSFSVQLFTLPSIPSFYAEGGFPSVGEMFIANEAGPEMIGRMGSGNAVATNDQIAQGFASQIYPAMYKAVSDAMSNSGGDINLTVKTELDGQVVYQNQEKVKRERGQNIGMGVFAR